MHTITLPEVQLISGCLCYEHKRRKQTDQSNSKYPVMSWQSTHLIGQFGFHLWSLDKHTTGCKYIDFCVHKHIMQDMCTPNKRSAWSQYYISRSLSCTLVLKGCSHQSVCSIYLYIPHLTQDRPHCRFITHFGIHTQNTHLFRNSYSSYRGLKAFHVTL